MTFDGKRYWIGLSKNKSDLKKVRQNEEDIFISDGECLTAKMDSSSIWQFSRKPCHWVRRSFCVRPRRNQEDNETDTAQGCGEGWTKYGDSQCLFPVYHQLTWFGAYIHCKRLNGHILKQEGVYNLSNTSFNIKDNFWIGKRYRFKIDSKRSNWTWNRDDVVFSQWFAWQIRIPRVGCHGCGFFDGREVILDSDCNETRFVICRFELLDSKYLPNATKRLSSWSEGEKICSRDLNSSLPQFTEAGVVKAFKNSTSDFPNASFWLGLRKKFENQDPCISIEVENDAKFTDYTLDKCYSVNCTNLGEKPKNTACRNLQHPLCYKRKADDIGQCLEPWQDCRNACCLVLVNLQTSWIAAYLFCLQQNATLADHNDLLGTEINISLQTTSKRCWLAERRVYTPRDPLDGWLWSDGTPLNSIGTWGVYGRLNYNGMSKRCATLVTHDTWEEKFCSYKKRYICKLEKELSYEKNATSMTKQSEITFKEMRNATNMTKQNEITRSEKIQNTIKQKSEQVLRDILNTGKYNVHLNQTNDHSAEGMLQIFTNFLIKMVNKSSFNSSFEIKKESFELIIFTTSLDKLQKEDKNKTSLIPIITLGKLCDNRQTCTIKGVQMKLKNITLNITLQWESTISDIISLSYLVEGKIVSELQENERILLQFGKANHNKKNNKNDEVHCMFLDGKKEWSQRGLTSGQINDKSVECFTNHLTSFSMVIVDAELDEENTQIFSLIGYIGSGLSIAALVLTSLVYIFLYNDIQVLSSSRQLVHFNLLVSLGGSQIVFLFGGNRSENEIFCKIVAILLHYFTLASFCWMLLEGVLLYLKLISVYAGEYIRMRRLFAFAWGFPLLFVTVSAAVNIDGYGTEEWCWLSYDISYFWVFFTPAIIIITLNVIIVVAVAHVLYKATHTHEGNEKQSICAAFRGIVILFPALGLSWIFGVIAVNHDALVWKYLFAILNSLQGLLIFLLYGVCNGEIKVALKRRLGRKVNNISSTT
ncbi:uncharacterized protein LOC114516590 [Dendronephthya gigantea]|uniref:uncharacterized protein LOC114516590 n=1 Tax=Dendronephthya gigantea TaxID=151771 RepID=UPI00106A1C3F|nr:uncharacterized protein LOC114516590 [Dendronephthya gigantea]